MVAILILNWNGWKDTFECLKSLQNIHYDKFFVVVGDNGSTNDSIIHIKEHCKAKGFHVLSDDIINQSQNIINNKDIVLLDLKINNGFAKGNNLMIRYCQKFIPNYYLLLNNDTEVAPDFLDKLVAFKKESREYDILTPLIPFYYNKTKIWNAGGKLFWGFRKYYYANRPISEIKEKQFIECSFITGCAMMITPAILNENNEVFSERFFFGEEDFEFSMRQNRKGKRMACVCGSIVYHKVSASSVGQSNINKDFIYYLNRFVNVKLTFSKFSYFIWKLIYVPYIWFLLSKTYSDSQRNNFISLLLKESAHLDSIDKSYFERTMQSTDLF